MKEKRYQPLALAVHEFHVGLRILPSEKSIIDLYKEFNTEKDKEFDKLSKLILAISILFFCIYWIRRKQACKN